MNFGMYLAMKMCKFDNVFDALYDDEQAIEMKRYAELASVLERFVQRRKLTQPQAARPLGVSQPRVNALPRGRLHRFSFDASHAMMDRAQIQVEFKVRCPKDA